MFLSAPWQGRLRNSDLTYQSCLDGRLYAPDLLHGLSKAVVACERGEDVEDDKEYKGNDVDVVVDAVGCETDNAGVESKYQKEEDNSGQKPHDAQRPRRIALETHIVVGERARHRECRQLTVDGSVVLRTRVPGQEWM